MERPSLTRTRVGMFPASNPQGRDRGGNYVGIPQYADVRRFENRLSRILKNYGPVFRGDI